MLEASTTTSGFIPGEKNTFNGISGSRFARAAPLRDPRRGVCVGRAVSVSTHHAGSSLRLGRGKKSPSIAALFVGFVLEKVKGNGEVAVHVRADVAIGAHRLAAHRAARSSGGDHCRRVGADLAGLSARESAGEIRADPFEIDGVAVVVIIVALKIVRGNDQAIAALVVAKFHSAGAELTRRLGIEIKRQAGRPKVRTGVWKLFKELFQRQAEGLQLLFLHPNDIGGTVDYRHQAESALPRLPDRLDSQPLRVEGGSRARFKRIVGHPTTFHIRVCPGTW